MSEASINIYDFSYFSIYSLVFVSIEKIYPTLMTVFHQISKHLEFRQKYSVARRIFNSLLGDWKSDETLSLVFSRLHCQILDIIRGLNFNVIKLTAADTR